MNARNMTDFSKNLLAEPAGLQATGISVAVAGKTLLHPMSASFAAGQVTAILGPNGAGKSTLMSVLTGQRQPDQGQVELNGQLLRQFDAADLARLRAFVAQETTVAFDFSVREVVELGRYPHRRQPSSQEAGIPDQAMQATAVDHLADRALNTLSGGEKARVHLARALAQVWEGAPKGVPYAAQGRPRQVQPRSGAESYTSVSERRGFSIRWLLLDEPTAALDLEHQHRLLKLARHWATAQGIGVVAVLHDLNLALRYSDRCVVLQSGRLAGSGVTAEVLSPQCIASVWKMAAWPVCVPAHAVSSPNAQDTGDATLQYVFAPREIHS